MPQGYTLTTNTRGFPVICYNGFRFGLRSSSKYKGTGRHWQCTAARGPGLKAKCPALLTLNDDRTVSVSGQHTHPPQRKLAENGQELENVKDESVEDPIDSNHEYSSALDNVEDFPRSMISLSDDSNNVMPLPELSIGYLLPEHNYCKPNNTLKIEQTPNAEDFLSDPDKTVADMTEDCADYRKGISANTTHNFEIVHTFKPDNNDEAIIVPSSSKLNDAKVQFGTNNKICTILGEPFSISEYLVADDIDSLDIVEEGKNFVSEDQKTPCTNSEQRALESDSYGLATTDSAYLRKSSQTEFQFDCNKRFDTTKQHSLSHSDNSITVEESAMLSTTQHKENVENQTWTVPNDAISESMSESQAAVASATVQESSGSQLQFNNAERFDTTLKGSLSHPTILIAVDGSDEVDAQHCVTTASSDNTLLELQASESSSGSKAAVDSVNEDLLETNLHHDYDKMTKNDQTMEPTDGSTVTDVRAESNRQLFLADDYSAVIEKVNDQFYLLPDIVNLNDCPSSLTDEDSCKSFNDDSNDAVAELDMDDTTTEHNYFNSCKISQTDSGELNKTDEITNQEIAFDNVSDYLMEKGQDFSEKNAEIAKEILEICHTFMPENITDNNATVSISLSPSKNNGQQFRQVSDDFVALQDFDISTTRVFDKKARKRGPKNSRNDGSTPPKSVIPIGQAESSKKIREYKTPDRNSHVCLYCRESKLHMPGHLVQKHKEEKDVIEAMETRDDKKRRFLFKKLVNKGDFQHDMSFEGKPGVQHTPHLRRKPIFETTNKSYYTCAFCYGRIQKASKYKHTRICFGKPQTGEIPSGQDCEAKAPPIDDDDGVWSSVLEGMRGKKGEQVLKKPLLYKFARSTWASSTMDNPNSLRCRLSYILLMEKKINEKFQLSNLLESYFTVGNVDAIIKIIREITGFKRAVDMKPEFECPAKAKTLSLAIEAYGDFLTTFYLKELDKPKSEEVALFLKVYRNESTKMKKQSRHHLKRQSFNKPVDLPPSKDIEVLTVKIELQTEDAMSDLYNDIANFKKWKILAANLAVRIILHNRRRVGEIDGLTITHFRLSISADTALVLTEEQRETMDHISKELLNRYNLVKVPGKSKEKPSAIVIEKEICPAIELLIATRKNVGIRKDNDFVFATRGKIGKFSTGRALSDARNKAFEVKFPALITATNLRKHIATASAALDLTKNEQDALAAHMGHDIRTHRQFYRKQPHLTELTDVNKILILGKTGGFTKNAGKKLADTQFPPFKAVAESVSSVPSTSNLSDPTPSTSSAHDMPGGPSTTFQPVETDATPSTKESSTSTILLSDTNHLAMDESEEVEKEKLNLVSYPESDDDYEDTI